jgi:hypothetical protein
MARKSFKTKGYTLYLTTSIGGVIKTQLVDRMTRELVEENYYASLDEEMEDYITSVGVSVTKIREHLNAI